MDAPPFPDCTAFAGPRRIASGDLLRVALRTKEVLDQGEQAPVLIFDETTGEAIDVDFRGEADEVARRLTERFGARPAPEPRPETPRGPGRPKLGVVAREVTLLPRHWEWLSSQPGGASVTLRKLVEEARRTHAGKDRIRQAQEATYRFMQALAGNLVGFEEATRALFASNPQRFDSLIHTWPEDIQVHARKLAAPAFQTTAPSETPT
ncbi:DUF2239 family protein [Citreicoccus inhibens]|uniref:DUF2239 family protein n=1 Tax=Citreicoccus inhibens TaxID=2849499 RepID=UPI001F3CC92F|nr:DUF2239 family protein [Citreicoccus inhibens]